MSPVDELRQDVETFGRNMAEMVYQFRVTGYAPIDLSTLVANEFINCKVLAFQLKATGLHDIFVRNPKSLSAKNITQTLEMKLHYLK